MNVKRRWPYLGHDLLCLLFLVVIFGACSNNLPETTNEKTLTRSIFDSLLTPYKFAVKVGDNGWKMLANGQAMLDVCQIPSEILQTLSTRALCESCMDYPLAFDYVYANDEMKSILFHIEHFNGLEELSNREDAFSPMVDAYQRSHYEALPEFQYGLRDNNIFYFGYIELLLSSAPFYNQFSPDQIGILKKAALEKYDYELENIDIFGLFSIRRTLMLISKCVLSEGNLNKNDKESIEYYIKNYQYVEAERLEEITKILTSN